jgi:histidinol-phosphatase (PHP family)
MLILRAFFRLIDMVLFDNHNHSEFSFDGKRNSVEACARKAHLKGLGGLAFTDHCDFFVPAMKAAHENLVPEVFDVEAQQEEIDRVSDILTKECSGRSPLKILKGIEVGMHENHHDDIRRMLSEHSFDQVIASVHYLEDTDPFYGGYYEGKDWKRAYGHYLETIWKEMTWLADFDIMGHFDYVVRYAPYPESCLRHKDFSDILDEMFRYLIYEGKALEINTKSYQTYKGREVMLDIDILKRYRELGGEVISLGSDAHDPDRSGHDFDRYADLLKSLGFRWTAHFEKRKLIQLPL